MQDGFFSFLTYLLFSFVEGLRCCDLWIFTIKSQSPSYSQSNTVLIRAHILSDFTDDCWYKNHLRVCWRNCL